jgi:hypothetical protein
MSEVRMMPADIYQRRFTGWYRQSLKFGQRTLTKELNKDIHETFTSFRCGCTAACANCL